MRINQNQSPEGKSYLHFQLLHLVLWCQYTVINLKWDFWENYLKKKNRADENNKGPNIKETLHLNCFVMQMRKCRFPFFDFRCFPISAKRKIKYLGRMKSEHIISWKRQVCFDEISTVIVERRGSGPLTPAKFSISMTVSMTIISFISDIVSFVLLASFGRT